MHRVLRVLSLVSMAVLLAASDGRADNWPRFRGPNGTGISHDKEIPVRWTDANILWKVRIPGLGNSSPVVWGDRLFVQSSTADGKERLLLCLNAATGQQLWSRSVPASRHYTHQKNTLASSTPATDGRAVYISVWDGKDILLLAYDFNGKPLWKHNVGPFRSQHGAGASPVVYDGRVFFADDQDGTSTLFALDARTGAIVWQTTRRPFRACYSAPFLLERSGEPKQLIVASTAGVTSYQPDSGTQNWDWLWEFSGMPQRTVASPLYADGVVFANSGDGSGTRHMVALRLDEGGATKIWENKRSLPYVPTMLALGHDLYWVHDQGVAGCLDARTGKPHWTARLEPTSASPIVIDGKIYAASEQGHVYVFPAAEKYHLLARNSLGESVIATPAVANHRLYIRGKEHLFCIGRTH